MMKKLFMMAIALLMAFPVMAQDDDPMQVLVGKRFIDVQLQDVKGQSCKLSDYVGKGKWVLIDFWASWCKYCRAEMPDLKRAYKKIGTDNFEVVGISIDEETSDWKDAIKELGLPWKQLVDTKGWKSKAITAYKVPGIPVNVLIDPSGKIAACNVTADQLPDMVD